MSDRSEVPESNDDAPFDDDLEQMFEDGSDEFDALLDEIGNASAPLEDETETLPESNVGDEDFDALVSLPEVDDELDLSSGDEAEIPVVDEREDTLAELDQVEEFQAEPEQPEAESREKPMNSDPLAEVAAIAAERNAEAAKQQGALAGRVVQLALAGVAILALAAAVFAAWQASSNASRVDELKATIEALQGRQPTAASTTPVDDGALRADLDKLMAQVNEMAATLDGSLVELREKNETALAAMQARLDKLEKEQTTAPVAAVKPMVENVPPASPSTTTSGGWSVNLISLSNEDDAEQELLRLRNLGIRAEKQRVEQDGRVWFRLRVPGFTSHDGAKAYIDTVQDKAGVENAWVGKN